MGSELAGHVVARAVTWPLAPALAAGALIAGPMDSSAVPYAVPILACWLVGAFLTWRAFHQVAGWAFLGLGTAIAWSAFADQVDGGDLLVVLSDSSFVWWFMFLALGLQFTPTYRRRSRLAAALPQTTVGAAVVFQLGALLRSTPVDASTASSVPGRSRASRVPSRSWRPSPSCWSACACSPRSGYWWSRSGLRAERTASS